MTLSLAAWCASHALYPTGLLPLSLLRHFTWHVVFAHLATCFFFGFVAAFLYRPRWPALATIGAALNGLFAMALLLAPTLVSLPSFSRGRGVVVASSGVVLLGLMLYSAYRGSREARLVTLGALVLAAATVYTGLLPWRGEQTGVSFLGLPLVTWAVVLFIVFLAYVQGDTFVRSVEKLEATHAATRRFVPQALLEATGRHDVTEAERGDAVGHRMSVMFSDIRDFTRASESMSPREVFALINDYLAVVTPAIEAAGGLVDKFIGDAVMALFPSPEAAVRGALDSLAALDAFNEERTTGGAPAIHVGVGVHHGPLVLGTLGSAERLAATVVGDTVNLASRIEGLSKYYGARLVVSAAVVEGLPPDHPARLRLLDRVVVKGKTEPVEVFAVLDAEPVAIADLHWAHRDTWTAILRGFADGAFEEIIPRLEALAEVLPGDATIGLYLERTRSLIASPPEAWHGIWVHRNK